MLLALLRKVPEVRRTTCSLEGALEQLKESAMPDADLNTRTLALTLTLTVTLTQESAMPDADLNGKASATSRAEEAAAGRSGDQKEKEAEAPRDGDEAPGLPAFVPSATNKGEVPGMVFKTGDQGPGYYRKGGTADQSGDDGDDGESPMRNRGWLTEVVELLETAEKD